jgi:hypothetical protein
MAQAREKMFAAESTPLPWAPPITQLNEFKMGFFSNLSSFACPSFNALELYYFTTTIIVIIIIRHQSQHRRGSIRMNPSDRSKGRHTYMHQWGCRNFRNLLLQHYYYCYCLLMPPHHHLLRDVLSCNLTIIILFYLTVTDFARFRGKSGFALF